MTLRCQADTGYNAFAAQGTVQRPIRQATGQAAPCGPRTLPHRSTANWNGAADPQSSPPLSEHSPDPPPSAPQARPWEPAVIDQARETP